MHKVFIRGFGLDGKLIKAKSSFHDRISLALQLARASLRQRKQETDQASND